MPQDTPRAIGLRQRLQNAGQPLQLSLNEMLRLYFLDGMLRRLAVSTYHPQFVLGGALLLYKLVLGPTQARLTQDSDFSADGLPADARALESALQTVIAQPVTDELLFDPTSVLVTSIMAGNPQAGLHARLTGYLGKARDTVSLDCSFGPVFPPGPQLRQLPSTLPGEPSIPVWTVPLEDILGGKVEGMLRRGAANTRYKDYWDVARLAETQDFQGDLLCSTLVDTCAYYGTPLTASGEVFASATFPTDPTQIANWQRFLARMRGTALSMPAFATVIQQVRAFYGPVLADQVQGKTWRHQAGLWP
jgi:hypothetical protein